MDWHRDRQKQYVSTRLEMLHYFLAYQVIFKWNLCSHKKVKISFKSNENCWELTSEKQYLCKRRYFACIKVGFLSIRDSNSPIERWVNSSTSTFMKEKIKLILQHSSCYKSSIYSIIIYERVSDYCFKIKWAIFQLYHGGNK